MFSFGVMATPISPTSCAQLKSLIEADCSGNYELQTNIDCSSESASPICSGGFSGVLDGNSKTITGLTINMPTTDKVGLIGRQNEGTIKNLNLANANIIGKRFVGSLVGENHFCSSFCITDVTVSGSVKGESNVGGVVGYSNSGMAIKNAYVDADVEATYDYAGGVCGGTSYGGATLNSCTSLGDIKGRDYVGGLEGAGYFTSIFYSNSKGKVTGRDHIGGLIGFTDEYITESYTNGEVNGRYNVGGVVGLGSSNYLISRTYTTGKVTGVNDVGGLVGNSIRDPDSPSLRGTIRDSYATGNVNGDYHIGGLVGELQMYIENSYATGDVSGINNVGGLVGTGYSTAIGGVTRSFAAGTVTSNPVGFNCAGGIAGYITNYATPITNSYWDKCRTEQQNCTSYCGGNSPNPGNCIGINSDGSQTTYFYNTANSPISSWDFTTIWDNSCGTNYYPILKNLAGQTCQERYDPCACQGTDNDNDYYSTSSADEGRMCCVGKTQNCLSGTDCNDGNAAIKPGATEICNNIDDDCDGTADEGLNCVCIIGATQSCGTDTGECQSGTKTCIQLPGGSDWGTCVGEIGPTTETCNNKDDDCDGTKDDNLIRSCGTGDCIGTETCSAGSWGSCTTNENSCDDGYYCNGADRCQNGACNNLGPNIDCSGNNLPAIATCTNNPDNNPKTWDSASGFTSTCNEINDQCTTSSYSYTHTCNTATCGAECEQNSNCGNYCDGNTRYYNGNCQGTCSCSYTQQNCPTAQLDDNNNICYYDAGSDGYCTPSGCVRENEACPDYCINDDDGGSCAITNHQNNYLDTTQTCYSTDTCKDSGCRLTSTGNLRAGYCDVCGASGVQQGQACNTPDTTCTNNCQNSGTKYYHSTPSIRTDDCSGTTCNVQSCNMDLGYIFNSATGCSCTNTECAADCIAVVGEYYTGGSCVSNTCNCAPSQFTIQQSPNPVKSGAQTTFTATSKGNKLDKEGDNLAMELCGDANCLTQLDSLTKSCGNKPGAQKTATCSQTAANCQYNNGLAYWIKLADANGQNTEGGDTYTEKMEYSCTGCNANGDTSCYGSNGADGKCDSSENKCISCNGAKETQNGLCEEKCGAENQCDEKAAGTPLARCGDTGYNYYGDKCSTTCGLEDDNICRDTSYGTGCTATTFCNGHATGYNDQADDQCCYGGCETLDCDSYDETSPNDNSLTESEVSNPTCQSACTGSGCCDIQTAECNAANECKYVSEIINNRDEIQNYRCYNNDGTYEFRLNAPMEICNHIDDDCDGTTDEGLMCNCYKGDTKPCTKQQGICQGSTETCIIDNNGNGNYNGCNYAIYSAWNPSYQEPWETTLNDALDNNCDGFPDDNDKDLDTIRDLTDNCNPDTYCNLNYARCYNPDQSNLDNENGGDVCDICPTNTANTCTDPNLYSSGKSINENGGTLTNNAGETTINIPTGTLNDDTSISMSKGQSNFIIQVSGRGAFALYSYELTAAQQTSFSQPITLTFYWGSYALTPTQITNLNVWYKDNNGNLQYADINGANGKIVDTTAKTITVKVNHFTLFILGIEEPKALKQVTMEMLDDMITTQCPIIKKSDCDKLKKAKKYLLESLTTLYWTGDSRLDTKKGEEVFIKEAKSVKKCIDAKNTASGCNDVITLLTEVDSDLAETALKDAQNLASQNPTKKCYGKKIELAQKFIAKGDAIKNTKPVKAIMYYKKSWQMSQEAIKCATQKKYTTTQENEQQIEQEIETETQSVETETDSGNGFTGFVTAIAENNFLAELLNSLVEKIKN
jgi:hypothetical protein